jgi:hypothetical protein
MSATKFPDTTLTAKILANITECHQRVGPPFVTCQQQTKMSVLWVVEPTDTNPDIASQAGEALETMVELCLWPSIVLLRKLAIYCNYIWYILRRMDFYALGLQKKEKT